MFFFGQIKIIPGASQLLIRLKVLSLPILLATDIALDPGNTSTQLNAHKMPSDVFTSKTHSLHFSTCGPHSQRS